MYVGNNKEIDCLLQTCCMICVFIFYKMQFNVFHVRALHYTKTQITSKMHKESFIINCNTLLMCSASRDHREFTPPKTMQYTVNSTFSLNYKVQL
jgi:hypothetical protein